jgi:hypothetical protein
LRILSVGSYQRAPENSQDPGEDACIIAWPANVFGVIDPSSAAYSPSNPRLMYFGGLMTGGQMVSYAAQQVAVSLTTQNPLADVVKQMNSKVHVYHQANRKDPEKDDVAGGCFAFCQPTLDGLEFLYGGDCWILVIGGGLAFFTGFDPGMANTESARKALFDKHKQAAAGNMAEAWDRYYPDLQRSRLMWTNLGVGAGGYASLNGSRGLPERWTFRKMPAVGAKTVLLGTDGSLPASQFQPRNYEKLATTLRRLYLEGGVEGIFRWRDELSLPDDDSHLTGKPEGTILALTF